MNKLCVFVGMTIFSWVGWWLGAKVGLMTAFCASSVGAILGVILGWKINKDYLS